MKKKRVILLGNHAFVIYNFRKELIQQLLKDGYEVYLSMPYDDEKVPLMESWGCKYIETNVDRRGTNPIKDIKLIIHYIKIIIKNKPDIALTYTVKPNLYGGLVCSFLRIPYLTNITGLGSGFKSENTLKKILVILYKIALKKSKKIYFQNTNDRDTLIQNQIVKREYKLIPGSGVNLLEFELKPTPITEEIRFIFIGRIMKDKGIHEYLDAAKKIKLEFHDKVRFDVLGFIEKTEKELNEKINDLEKKGYINYLGYQSNVKSYIEDVHCLIQPSHGGEGISNVLLEAGAMGKILIASNIPGCRETIEIGKNGFLFEAKNHDDLKEKIENVINLKKEDIISMSNNSRGKMEKEFDRNIVVNEYIKSIRKIIFKG
ncbi:glycosyltransferase family 4 protein [Exiguobacterium indicum]|uniref:glycosyltransferase family 4 protein n=1 Tax=Exiguobacterium indicum TaxID=296995 RepID=UPI003981F8BC